MKTYKKEASALIFVTIVIFLLIIMVGFSIDIGLIYLHFAKLQAVCDNASHSGSTVVAEMILNKTDDNKNSEFDALNALDLLTEEDIEEIVASYDEVSNVVLDYIDINARSNNVDNYNYEIIYPYDYEVSDKEVFTKVILSQQVDLLFGDLFETENMHITVESISSMPIRN